MRVAFTLALIGCLAALAPCPPPAAHARASAHRCCCDPGTACCCRGEDRPVPAREPGTPSSNAAPRNPAELAVGEFAEIPTATVPAASWILARLAGAETGPVYLATRSFRC